MSPPQHFFLPVDSASSFADHEQQYFGAVNILPSFSMSSSSANLSTSTSTVNAFDASSNNCEQLRPKSASIAFGICLPIVCLIGAFLNIVKAFVLADRRELPAPSYVYMTALSVSHAVTLTFEGLLLFGVHFLTGTYVFELVFPYLLWPIFSYGLTLSLCIFVAFTVETYFYVRCLTPASQITTEIRQDRARVVLVALVLFAFAFNFPRTAAYKINPETGCHEARWSAIPGSWFSIYTYCRFLLFNLGSLALLLVFHLLLVAFLCKHSRSNTVVADNERKMRDLRRLTIALVLSVVFVIIVESVILLLNPITVAVLWDNVITTHTGRGHFASWSRLAYALITVEYLMIFVFSLLFNTSFRRHFIRKLACSVLGDYKRSSVASQLLSDTKDSNDQD